MNAADQAILDQLEADLTVCGVRDTGNHAHSQPAHYRITRGCTHCRYRFDAYICVECWRGIQGHDTMCAVCGIRAPFIRTVLDIEQIRELP